MVTLSCGTDERQECYYVLSFPENAIGITYTDRYGTTSKAGKYLVFFLKPGDVNQNLTATGQYLDIQGYNGAEVHFYNIVEGETTYVDLEYTYLDSGGGDDSGGSSSGLIPDGTLSSVIGGISDTMGEFIPYVVYIGLGSLILSLGFVGMKWLMLYLYKKLRSKF